MLGCVIFKAHVPLKTLNMTTINHNVKPANLKKEIRQIREIAKKVAGSKASALRFLKSTGMHSSSGQLKPQFR